MISVLAFAIAICLAAHVGCSNNSNDNKNTAKKETDNSNDQPTGNQPKPKRGPNQGKWLMFRGGPKATGVADGQLADKLDVLWKFDVKNGGFDGSPVIEDGVVYIGEGNGTLFALDLATGQEQWRFPKDDKESIGFIGSAAIRNDLIYIGDLDGVLFCVDKNGKEKWRFQVDAPITSSVNFYQDKVIFGAEDAILYCLEAATGKKIWEFETADEIRCMPTVVDNRAFVTGCDGVLHIVDIDKGEEIAGVNVESPTLASPAVLGDQVFFGSGQMGFLAVNWKQAKIDWRFPDENEIYSSPAVIKIDKTKYVIYGSKGRKVFALDGDNKNIIWQFATKREIDSSPLIVGNRVVVLSGDGRLYLLNLKDGKKVFEKQFSGGFVSSPAAVGDQLVIATMRGTVYCLGSK